MAAGGAVVVNVGHGDPPLVDAMAAQAARSLRARTMFTTEASRPTRTSVAPVLPMDGPRIYPVSGGSEAVETALKLARAYHLARGDEDRDVVFGRRYSYHGNTLGALDLGGKEALRRPYAPWLGRVRARPGRLRVPVPLTVPAGCAPLAEALEAAIVEAGPSGGRVHRRAGRGRDARGRRAEPTTTGPRRRGVPAPRRAPGRRRGHDGVRADRPLVRRRPLGGPARRPDRGKGVDERLLPVRVRGVRR